MANNNSIKTYKYYDFIMAAFVCVLILSNLVGAGKVSVVDIPGFGAFEYGAGILFFPISYIIGDILTEVYGYARARRVVWTGFGAMVFMAITTQIIVAMPPADRWEGQSHYEWVFNQTPRIVFASMIAFWAGEFANAYVMAKMKVQNKTGPLWQRTIGSTIIGQGIDSAIFYPLAFYGLWDNTLVMKIAFTAWITKVLWEMFLTPVTYKVVSWLKDHEDEDFVDADTDFTPFSVKR
jgi:hypothetical protein